MDSCEVRSAVAAADRRLEPTLVNDPQRAACEREGAGPREDVDLLGDAGAAHARKPRQRGMA